MIEQIKIENLVYSDVEFIALKYEESTGESPSSQFTKTEGMKAGLSIPIVSAGVHTQETKTYNLSSLGMLNKIYPDLKGYPMFDKDTNSQIDKPQVVWVQGRISVSSWKQDEEKYTFFELLSNSDNDNSNFSLVTKAEYISSGYDSLLGITPILRDNINIPVFALIKILYLTTAAKTYVSTPLLIIER